MFLNFRIVTFILPALALFISTAAAQDHDLGPYVSIEGRLGYIEDLLISQGRIAVSRPEKEWQEGLSPSEIYGARIEAGWSFEGYHGLVNRIGLVYSGSWIDSDLSDDYYGAVLIEPDATGKPQGEIVVCPSGLGSPCSEFNYTAKRQSHEVKPSFMLGKQIFNGPLLLAGLEPFFGIITESSAASLASGLGIQSNWESVFVGGLFALELQVPFAEKYSFTVGAGIGPYTIHTDSRVEGITRGAKLKGSANDTGFRAQLSLATEYMLSSSFSLGLVGRLDYWSASPNISGYKSTWGGVPCKRKSDGSLVCEPPRVSSDPYQVSYDHSVDLSAGVKLKYKFGK